MTTWHERHPEWRKAYRLRWYRANKEKIRAQAKKRRADNLEKHRARDHVNFLRHRYGLSPQEKAKLLSEQGGRCAGCGTDNPRTKKGWQIDHCHATGAIRGILCHHCNATLGNAKDSIDRLRALVEYLLRKAQ